MMVNPKTKTPSLLKLRSMATNSKERTMAELSGGDIMLLGLGFRV